MSDVAVIGLGLMGAALAAAFQKNGNSLTVWNRTASKCDPFVEAGAHAAASVEDALAASDLVVVCLDDYPVTRALLENPAAGGQLSGKALVQLSTGTPMQARLEHEWMQHHGANYLDGAILNGPPAIGTKHGHILVSGDRSAWEQSQSLSIAWAARSVSKRAMRVPPPPSTSPGYQPGTDRSSASLMPAGSAPLKTSMSNGSCSCCRTIFGCSIWRGRCGTRPSKRGRPRFPSGRRHWSAFKRKPTKPASMGSSRTLSRAFLNGQNARAMATKMSWLWSRS